MIGTKLLFYEETQCKRTVSAVPRPNSATLAAEVIVDDHAREVSDPRGTAFVTSAFLGSAVPGLFASYCENLFELMCSRTIQV
jgi:hypothetical protein